MNNSTIIKEENILKYNIALYLLLLVVESGIKILFSFIGDTTGKVLSMLYADFKNIFYMILPELFFYVVAIVSIYVFFAWANTKIIQHILLKIKKTDRFKNNDNVVVYVLFLVNGLFILINYYFIGVLYPTSQHDVFDFNTLPQLSITTFIFYAFVLCYFFVVYWSLSNSRKAVRYGFAALFLLSFSYNFWPQVQPFFLEDNLQNKNKGPNVIILGVDSLRFDHLVRNNYPYSIAPNVENFLKKSVVFSKAYTPLARTFPSWMSILTGKYPSETGMRYNLIQRQYYTNSDPTLPELLKEEYGYHTVHAMDETRFCNLTPDDGFDELMQPVTGFIDFFFGRIHDFSLSNLYFNNRVGSVLFPFIINNRAIPRLYDGKQFVQDIENKLASLSKKDRFFFSAHLCAAHWPYFLRGSKKGTRKKPLSTHEEYEESIKFADNQLGLILEAIKRNNIYDNSIIILLSDHGESFDSSEWGHGTSLYDNSQNHIVLGIKPAGFNGHYEDDRIVSTIDLAPTVVNLLGVESNSHYTGQALFAKSENKRLNNLPKTAFMETGFHFYHSFGRSYTLHEMVDNCSHYYKVVPETKKIIVKDEYHEEIIDAKQLALLTDQWKLIAQKNKKNEWNVELFKLDDKMSSTNVRDQFPQVVEKLIPQLSEHFGVDIQTSQAKTQLAAILDN